MFISKDAFHISRSSHFASPPFPKFITITTNNTQKHSNVNVNAMQYLQHPQYRTSPSPSATSSVNTPTMEELQEQNKELKRLLRNYKGLGLPSIDLNFTYFANIPEKPRATETKTKPIVRPKGEAGSRKRGFILYDAMEMGKVENGPIVYDRMRVCECPSQTSRIL